MQHSANTPSAAPARGGTAGLWSGRVVELESHPRIGVLIDMMREVSHASTPTDVGTTFGERMRRLRGIDGYLGTSVRGLAPGSYKVTRKLLRQDEEENELPNPWLEWDRLPLSRGGVLGELMARGGPSLIHDVVIASDPVLADALAEFRCIAAVPLFDGGEALNWGFFLGRKPQQFDSAFVEEFLVTTNLIGGTIKNVIANQRLREAEAVQSREIDRIARIQRSLLPRPLPVIDGAGLAASYATFDRAGGDLYAVRSVRVQGSNRPWWLLLIADASGHGPSAAVVSAMVDAIVATVPEPVTGPGAILSIVNDYLYSKSIENGFVTAFLGLFEPVSREFRYARAGHNPPLVRSICTDHTIRFLEEAGDIPLGIAPSIVFEEATTTFQPGETVVLYTDGIVEARNPARAMFGVGRIEEALRTCSGAPDCAVRSISGALIDFEAGVRPGDDQTLLVLQVDDLDGACGAEPPAAPRAD